MLLFDISPFSLIYRSSIVDFSGVDEFLSSANGNFLGVGLVQQRVVCRLDGVHGVLGSGYAGGDVVQAGSTAHFEDAVRAAQTKA